MSAVIRHVVDSISPASGAFAEAARATVAAAGAPILEQLAARLGGAQHTARPRVDRRTLVVCAGDHGCGDPGISLGASHPTVIGALAIADGTAALVDVARAGRAAIMIVDAGVAEPSAMPPSTIRLGRGPTRDLLREPAMTVVDATLGLEAGIALAMSLSEAGLDILVLGALGVGSELAAAALWGATRSARGSTAKTALSAKDRSEQSGSREADPALLADKLPVPDSGPGATRADGDPDLAAAFEAGYRMAGRGGLELLAAFGGPETAVMAGLIVGAASIHTPVVLDGLATGAAALVAAALAPAVTGYLIAAHAGSGVHGKILARLGLVPVFAVGLGHGEGIGAAIVLPLIDQVAALAGK